MPTQKDFNLYERVIDEDGEVTIPSREGGETAKVVTANRNYFLCESTVQEDGTVPIGEQIDFGKDFAGKKVHVKVK